MGRLKICGKTLRKLSNVENGHNDSFAINFIASSVCFKILLVLMFINQPRFIFNILLEARF